MTDYHRIHADACEAGELYYNDPTTGYRVFTAISLEKRESCCGCGCRHCPYGHTNVHASNRKDLIHDPWVLGDHPGEPCDILFWSGGKDSYLAYRALQRENKRPVALCTTYDGRSEFVAHQNISVHVIKEQAKLLGLPLLLIPLYPEFEYLDRIELGVRVLQRLAKVERFVFGDLHLEHIRDWREDQLSQPFSNIELYFPLWNVPYEDLMDDLFQSNVTCDISSIASEECASLISVGDRYDQDLIAKLPKSVDVFGENGEFHTVVRVPPT